MTLNRLPESLRPFVSALQGYQRILVAYSGGKDSHVLLHALQQFRAQLPPIVAFNVDHQLQSASADWARHCQQVCAALDLPIICVQVDARAQPGESPEEAARKHRYQAFANELRHGEVILLAQHQQDQSETILLQLMRGAGPAGLAGMPEKRVLGQGTLMRPLLQVSPEAISDYAKAHALQWVEDPSNAALHYDRNFLRHQVLPILYQRWPQLDKALSKTALCCAGYQQRHVEQFQGSMQQCVVGNLLQINALCEYAEDAQLQIIRLWLAGLLPQLPESKHLQHILRDLVHVDAGRQGQVCFAGHCVTRFGQQLYLLPRAQLSPNTAVNSEWFWSGKEPLLLPTGRLIAEQPFAQLLRVTYRQGGETIRLLGHRQHKQVKHLFQEALVVPWQRDKLPFIWDGGHLLQVGNVFYSDLMQQVIHWFPAG